MKNYNTTLTEKQLPPDQRRMIEEAKFAYSPLANSPLVIFTNNF